MDEVNNKIKPTDDFIFKRLFGVEENKDLLIAFLNALFDEYDCFERIIDLEYKNTEIPKVMEESKSARLDIRAKVNENTYIDIEVQSKDTKNLVNRGIFYNSFMIVDEVEEGSLLYDIPRVISVWILKGELDKNSIFKDYKSPIALVNLKTDKSKFGDEVMNVSKDFNMIYIFLSKFKEGMLNKNLENWLKFVDNQDVFDVNDDEIIKANRRLTKLKGNKEMHYYYESILKGKFDYNLGVGEGIKQGIEKGLKEGLKEGQKKEKIEIAKNMLKLNININIISQSTGLSVEEIKELKD